MSIGAIEHIERLNKIFADCVETVGMHARPGYTFQDRELNAYVGPMEYEQAMAALEAMPFGYNDFSRERLRVQLRMLGEGTTAIVFGRDSSPFVQFVTDRPADEVGVIFQDAESILTHEQGGASNLFYVYWG